VRVIVWDGNGKRPTGADEIEFFVARYDIGPPPAGALAGLPKLRAVQLLSAGVEHWVGVQPAGVPLFSGRGVHGQSTAELAVAGMLAILRRLPAYEQARAAHRWQREPSGGLAGQRVLVIGSGDIGTRIATAVRALEAEATMVARTARPGVASLGDVPGLLPDFQVVALAVPHTPETDKMVDARFLAAMPDGALLVNVARGALVDTDALLVELNARRLYAYLDVTDPEPPPANHPLWDAPNLFLTPHVGGGAPGWHERAFALVRDQVLRFRAGQPLINEVVAGY
jgi:phosphoglycerate dehydrogenase-like enzyme